MHARELVHRLRNALRSPGAASRPLWSATCQTANRWVAATVRTAGIAGPDACARWLRDSFGVKGPGPGSSSAVHGSDFAGPELGSDEAAVSPER